MTVGRTIEPASDRNDELKVRRDAVRFLRIPAHAFVMVDGTGPPVPAAFEARMPGLYATAYGLRFALKARGVPGRVGPLEGLWWQADGSTDLAKILDQDRSSWRWTLMIGLPEEATDEEIEGHLMAGRAKVEPAVGGSLRVERFEEGDVAQVLHIGPYAEEAPSIQRLHAGIESAGFVPRGRHHELYLGDPRRSAPERLRTLLRHQIERAPT